MSRRSSSNNMDVLASPQNKAILESLFEQVFGQETANQYRDRGWQQLLDGRRSKASRTSSSASSHLFDPILEPIQIEEELDEEEKKRETPDHREEMKQMSSKIDEEIEREREWWEKEKQRSRMTKRGKSRNSLDTSKIQELLESSKKSRMSLYKDGGHRQLYKNKALIRNIYKPASTKKKESDEDDGIVYCGLPLGELSSDIHYNIFLHLDINDIISCLSVCTRFLEPGEDAIIKIFFNIFGEFPGALRRPTMLRWIAKAHAWGTRNMSELFLWSAARGYSFFISRIIDDKLVEEMPRGVNTAKDNGNTAAHIACERNQLTVLKILVSAGVDLNKIGHKGRHCLHVAAATGRSEILEYLLSNFEFNINIVDEAQCTPLHLAAQYGREEAIRVLLSFGADQHLLTSDHKTALYLAAEEGKSGAVQVLLENGSDVTMASETGKTPLYAAAENGFVKCVRLLLEYNSNVRQETARQKIALYPAAEKGHVEVVRLLLPHSKVEDLFILSVYGTTAMSIAAKQPSKLIKKMFLMFCLNQQIPQKGETLPPSLAQMKTPRYMEDLEGFLSSYKEKNSTKKKLKRGESSPFKLSGPNAEKDQDKKRGRKNAQNRGRERSPIMTRKKSNKRINRKRDGMASPSSPNPRSPSSPFPYPGSPSSPTSPGFGRAQASSTKNIPIASDASSYGQSERKMSSVYERLRVLLPTEDPVQASEIDTTHMMDDEKEEMVMKPDGNNNRNSNTIVIPIEDEDEKSNGANHRDIPIVAPKEAQQKISSPIHHHHLQEEEEEEEKYIVPLAEGKGGSRIIPITNEIPVTREIPVQEPSREIAIGSETDSTRIIEIKDEQEQEQEQEQEREVKVVGDVAGDRMMDDEKLRREEEEKERSRLEEEEKRRKALDKRRREEFLKRQEERERKQKEQMEQRLREIREAERLKKEQEEAPVRKKPVKEVEKTFQRLYETTTEATMRRVVDSRLSQQHEDEYEENKSADRDQSSSRSHRKEENDESKSKKKNKNSGSHRPSMVSEEEKKVIQSKLDAYFSELKKKKKEEELAQKKKKEEEELRRLRARRQALKAAAKAHEAKQRQLEESTRERIIPIESHIEPEYESADRSEEYAVPTSSNEEPHLPAQASEEVYRQITPSHAVVSQMQGDEGARHLSNQAQEFDKRRVVPVSSLQFDLEHFGGRSNSPNVNNSSGGASNAMRSSSSSFTPSRSIVRSRNSMDQFSAGFPMHHNNSSKGGSSSNKKSTSKVHSRHHRPLSGPSKRPLGASVTSLSQRRAPSKNPLDAMSDMISVTSLSGKNSHIDHRVHKRSESSMTGVYGARYHHSSSSDIPQHMAPRSQSSMSHTNVYDFNPNHIAYDSPLDRQVASARRRSGSEDFVASSNQQYHPMHHHPNDSVPHEVMSGGNDGVYEVEPAGVSHGTSEDSVDFSFNKVPYSSTSSMLNQEQTEVHDFDTSPIRRSQGSSPIGHSHSQQDMVRDHQDYEDPHAHHHRGGGRGRSHHHRQRGHNKRGHRSAGKRTAAGVNSPLLPSIHAKKEGAKASNANPIVGSAGRRRELLGRLLKLYS